MSGKTIMELYETLVGGGTFKLRFATRAELKKFRDTLGTVKYRQEKDAIATGMLPPAAVKTISVQYEDDTGMASFKLIEKQKNSVTFDVIEEQVELTEFQLALRQIEQERQFNPNM